MQQLLCAKTGRPNEEVEGLSFAQLRDELLDMAPLNAAHVGMWACLMTVPLLWVRGGGSLSISTHRVASVEKFAAWACGGGRQNFVS